MGWLGAAPVGAAAVVSIPAATACVFAKQQRRPLFLAPSVNLIFEDVALPWAVRLLLLFLTLLRDLSEKHWSARSVRHDDKDAVVRATLAAVNRRSS